MLLLFTGIWPKLIEMFGCSWQWPRLCGEDTLMVISPGPLLFMRSHEVTAWIPRAALCRWCTILIKLKFTGLEQFTLNLTIFLKAKGKYCCDLSPRFINTKSSNFFLYEKLRFNCEILHSKIDIPNINDISFWASLQMKKHQYLFRSWFRVNRGTILLCYST